MSGPVFITHRGKPAHVLLCIADYWRLTDEHRNLAESLAMAGLADIDFRPPSIRIKADPPDLC